MKKKLLLLFALTCLGAPSMFSQTIDYTFVTVGCNRVDYLDTAATSGTLNSTGASTANVYQLKRLFTEVSQLKPLPKYLFLTGDLVMGYINDTLALAKQLRSWRHIYEQHPLSSSGIKLVAIPGNHETQDKAAGKKSFVAAERTFVREMAPYILGNNGPGIGGADNLATDQSRLTYSFNFGCDHFVIINTDPVGQDSRTPYNWIANDLKNARAANARHIFAFGHKPAYSSPFKPLDGLEAFVPQRDSLWKYFEAYSCQAMFAAHEHVWDTIHPHIGKTWQIISGNGGSKVESTWMGANAGYFGFTLISIFTNGKINLKSYGRNADMNNYTLNADSSLTTLRNDFNLGLLPVIEHIPQSNTANMGPFVVNATITDDIAVLSTQLNYSLNGVNQTPLNGVISGNNYSFTIPAQNISGIVQYTIAAKDMSGTPTYSTGCSGKPHQFTFGLKTGPSTTQSPYLLPLTPEANFTSILSVGDSIGNYKLAGLPDGLGAFDNNDGTFTLLTNHEIGSTLGAVRAHGVKGAYVSKWIIRKTDLSVLSGTDLIKNVHIWNGSGYTSYNASNPSTVATFSRFCSADLPAASAFYNHLTGMGTGERIFMNGEESGTEGRAVAHIITGSNAGNSYELPFLGKASWENAVASPSSGDKTVVALMDDGTDGQVYFYVGTKTNAGNEIEKAGLSNGRPLGVKVNGFTKERVNSTTLNPLPAAGTRFSLTDIGSVENLGGTAFNTASNNAGITSFSRPEDGSWDPINPNDFYFNTTDQLDRVADGNGTQIGRSRVWRLHFDNITQPELGGTIEAVLDGTEGVNMLDNMTIDNYGHILLQEDVGNAAHNGKIWQYSIANDSLMLVAKHDPSRFGELTVPATSPFNQDEESSGIIDVQSILGQGMFLLANQAHYSIPGELVEGGQLLAFFNPSTYYALPNTFNVNGGGFRCHNAEGLTVSLSGSEKGVEYQLLLNGNNVGNTVIGNGNELSFGKQALAGTYTVIGINSITKKSVQMAGAAVINVNPALTIDAGVNKIVYLGYKPMSCANLTATAIGGGTAPYSLVWNTGSNTNSIKVCPTVSSQYTVTLTDAAGCSHKDSVEVCVKDVRCGNNNVKVCATFKLFGRIIGRQTYCVNENTATLLINYFNTALTTWNIGACGTSADCIFDNKSTHKSGNADIDENFGEEALTEKEFSLIYGDATLHLSPNPVQSNNLLNIEVLNVIDKKVELNIYSVLGELVVSEQLDVENRLVSKQLNLNQILAPGTYIVNIRTKNNVFTQKLIVE